MRGSGAEQIKSELASPASHLALVGDDQEKVADWNGMAQAGSVTKKNQNSHLDAPGASLPPARLISPAQTRKLTTDRACPDAPPAVFNYAKHVMPGPGSMVYPRRSFMDEETETKLAAGDAAIAKAVAIRKARMEQHGAKAARADKESIVEH